MRGDPSSSYVERVADMTVGRPVRLSSSDLSCVLTERTGGRDGGLLPPTGVGWPPSEAAGAGLGLAGVGAVAAVGEVGSLAADQGVVAVETKQPVVAGKAAQHVVQCVTDQDVVAGAADDVLDVASVVAFSGLAVV